MSEAENLKLLSDTELVEMHGQIGDPDYRKMVEAEERRRGVEKANRHASRANWISAISLLVATASLAISLIK